MGSAIVWLVNILVSIMTWFIIAQAILSWLVAFNIVNTRSGIVYSIARFLDTVTAPLLEPARRVIPNLGGIDISPIVVLLALRFAQIIFNNTAAGPLIATLG